MALSSAKIEKWDAQYFRAVFKWAGYLQRAGNNDPNRLSYQVVEEIAALARQPLSSGSRACGIVYTLSRKETESVARSLTQAGVASRAYHAGLPPHTRRATFEAWMRGAFEPASEAGGGSASDLEAEGQQPSTCLLADV
ncbi:unnamed protein product [Prorocentrum cordatum]|uniref:RNA helicase n=1 Tax=Prorocentrum cordatum TaxID=2364126 RepID=A0ABN9PPQ6_9DINO|nr:unnamed protein product [Polarella glacialis]